MRRNAVPPRRPTGLAWMAAPLALLLAQAGPVLRAQGPEPARAQADARRLEELRRKVEGDNRLNPVQSIPWEREALALLADGRDPKAQAWFLRSEVRDLNTLFRAKEAREAFAQAREITSRHGTERDNLLLEVEGLALVWRIGKADETVDRTSRLIPALEAFCGRNPKDSEAIRTLGRALRIQANATMAQGRFPEAIRSCQRALDIYQSIGDLVGQARVYDLMGVVYEALDQLQDALASHRSAIALADQTGDSGLEATVHLGLANCYGLLDDPKVQAEELKRASDFADKAGDSSLQLLCTVNLADAFLRRKDYRQVLHYAELGIKLGTAANDISSVAVSKINKGIAVNRMGNPGEGIPLIQEGLEYYRDVQDRNGIADVTRIVAEEYAAAGDFRRAYETEVKFKEYSDDLRKDQDKKRLAEASAAFENDKKELQISALQRDRRNQARLRLLWTALGFLGFATAGVLVVSRKKLKAANRSLSELSLRDPLTSLANRRYLAMHISEDLAQAVRLQRAGQHETGKARMPLNIDLIFLMIDIDHFKEVNDQYGHTAGDRLLKQFAFVLQQTMRDSDTVVRWGGEEFFVLAKHTSRHDASLVAERIRSRVESFPFDLGNGQTLHKTCSLGFASFPFHRLDPTRMPWEKVLEAADQCLYAAKTMGRNTWVGVREVDGIPADHLPPSGAYPYLADLLTQGVVAVETKDDRPVVWGA